MAMPNISTGMKVVGVNGHNIGRVKDVADGFFVLHEGWTKHKIGVVLRLGIDGRAGLAGRKRHLI